MTIIQKFTIFTKKKLNFFYANSIKTIRIQRFNPFIIISFLIVFSAIFFVSLNLIKKKNNEDGNNLKEITKNDEFSNLTNFLVSKINSPYEEISYVIKNNDTVEKILKQFKIQNNDIREISVQLKDRKTY